ncbi:MAG: chemotaxis protein CheW [Gammaproteobacteria bacterium]
MNLEQQLNETTQTLPTAAGQYLTFILAGTEYGVDILRVQEIKGWDTATEIPNTPEYIRGIINLRGTIVPIVDLRKRLHMEAVAYGNTTVVVVLKVKGAGGERTMGFVVDAVSDVYQVTVDQIKAAPDFGTSVSTEFVKGLAAVGDKIVILLEIDQLVDAGVAMADHGLTH